MIGESRVSERVFNFLSKQMLNRARFLEVGTFDGLTISKLAKEHPTKEFVAIDDFSEGCKDHFIHNNFENKNVCLFSGESERVLANMNEEGMSFDVIFIDANHEYEFVIKDFLLSYTLLSEKGVMIFHDRKYPGVHRALEEGCKKLDIGVHIFDEFVAWFEKEQQQ